MEKRSHERFFIYFSNMNMRYFIALLACLFVMNGTKATEKKKVAKSGKAYASLVSANVQRTVPGARGSQPIMHYSFVLKWKSKEIPETFFWRGKDAWMNCKVTVFNSAACKKGSEIPLEKLKSGNYILLQAIPGGKFPMPEEIQNTKGDDLFFKTGKSGWLYLAVTKITKQKDLLMP